jgi:hypothetical protein
VTLHNDEIQNYVAGLPFPLVDAADPAVGTKIAYNWHWGPFVPDDVMLFSSQRSRAYEVKSTTSALNPRDDESDFRSEGPCDTFVFIRYAHRSKMKPIPRISPALPFEWKVRGFRCGAAKDISPSWTERENPVQINYRIGDTSLSGAVGFFRWALRSVPGVYASEKCTYGCTRFWWEYLSPPPAAYKFRFLGMRRILACLHAQSEGAGIRSNGRGSNLGEEEFELRNAYVLEAVPLTEHISAFAGAFSIRPLRAVVYIDTETFLLLGFDLEHAGFEDSVLPLWTVRSLPNGGGNELELANELFVPGNIHGLFLSLQQQPGGQKINTGVVDDALFGN